ncbi:hypothetical protein D3C85_1850020 [compost metagenome]
MGVVAHCVDRDVVGVVAHSVNVDAVRVIADCFDCDVVTVVARFVDDVWQLISPNTSVCVVPTAVDAAR